MQAIEKATAPFALKLFFSLDNSGFAVCSPGAPSSLSGAFFPLELAGFALRVTAPLIVLAVSKMVCCSLSVGSLLLNAASGTPEHLDQSIELSWLYFPHCPHHGDVCNNWREDVGDRVCTQTLPASLIQMRALWWGEGCLRTVMASVLAVPAAPQACSMCSEPAQLCVINSSVFAGKILLSIGSGCCETVQNEVGC